MRIFLKIVLCLSIPLVFLLVATTFSISGELIEPTRTLESSEKTSGEISVFSEPPDLDVYLDNSKIGKTPIASIKIEAGIHLLKVKDSETKIYVVSGKSLRLSFHKGSFIQIQEKEREKPKKPDETSTEKKESDAPAEEKKEPEPKYDPLYWPLNPKGPIQ